MWSNLHNVAKKNIYILYWTCQIAVHHKIKNYLCGAINIITKCEKACQGVFFFKLESSHLIFTKNKTPSQMFFHGLQ